MSGVKPKRNNAQHQPLTTALRNIIREYPSGGGVLRELTQNADDAGANTVEFVLDDNHHPCNPLLHNGLAEFQGPSLLAFNNKTFSDRDFRSLSRIGDSEKAHDLSATGKFGRGFNSVYNWTDGPSILSGTSLLLLDPHESWSRDPAIGEPGGPVYDFVENAQEPVMINQLSPFKQIVTDFSRPFEGTVIRLPLRTADQAKRSKILDLDPKPTEIADIKEVFNSFAAEISESLLFLRNVSSITLRIGDEIFARGVAKKYVNGVDITASFSINEPYDSVLVRGEQSRRDESFLMEICFEQNGEENVSKYALTHHMRRHIENDSKLEEWARKFKLLPWVAIASPLSQDRAHEHVGRMFSTLPLPVPSNQPAHIHGMFSIRPDRSTIHSGDDTAVSQSAEGSKGAKWNKWLLQECIVDAWISNLQFIQQLTAAGACDFQGWTRWPAGFQAFSKRESLGTGTLGVVFTRIFKEELRLLPTISDTTAKGSEVLFASKLDEPLKDALREAGVVVMYPPSDRIHEILQLSLDSFGISYISPKAVRTALTKLSDRLNTLTPISRSILLDYILSDESYVDAAKCRAPLLPMMDGSYQDLRVSSVRYRFSRGSESSLFSECKAYLIYSSKLSPTSLHHFNNRMDRVQASTNVCNWDIAGAAWYCREYLFKCGSGRNAGDTISRSDLAGWIDQFWSWAASKAQANPSALISAVADLWLVPLTGDRYRKVGTSSPPTLDISGTGNVAAIFRAVLKSSTLAVHSYPLYSGSGMSAATTAFLKSGSVTSDCENIHALIFWLSSISNFLDAINDEQRLKLLRHIGCLAQRGMYQLVKKERDSLQVAMRKLALFREAFSNLPSRKWIDLNQTNIRYVAVSPIDDSLPVIDYANTIFIEKSDPGVVQILEAFGLAELPSTQEILEKFIIPKITSTSGEIRTPYSKFVLKSSNMQLLSRQAKEELANTSFIPVANSHLPKCPSHLVDPESDAAGLYFDDENVFPAPDYLKEFRESLKLLQMITAVTDRVVLDRLRKYSGGLENIVEISSKVQHLFNAAPKPPSMTTEHRELRWIPASLLGEEIRLYNSHECRDKSEAALFKYSMPLTELDVPMRWKTDFGWFRPPETRHILKQLDEAVARSDNAVITSLLINDWLSPAEVSKELDGRTWVPGIAGGYYRCADVFLENAEFHPYVDVLNSQFREYFDGTSSKAKFAVGKTPGFQKLKDVHDILVAKEKVEGIDLKVFVSLLDAFATQFPKADLTTLCAPDADGIPRHFADITADITAGRAHADDPEMMDLTFIHPTISPKTIKSLKIPTIQDRFLARIVGPEFIQQFEQEQDLTSLISDTLQRYPIESTFGEYLANAEDSRTASKICWVADETAKYPAKSLITSYLSECQGPALFCYNDGVFTEKDFAAVIRIGVGSKRDEPSKIGRFGRGSLTMYHWTCTPSYISGEYFVIFDPEQTRLPLNPATGKLRRGMRMKIKEVRRMYPDQLRPFHGLFEFTPQSDFFKGTLFRFPVMKSRNLSSIYCSKAIRYTTIQSALATYHKDALVSLLFLKKIQSIEFWERQQDSGTLVQRWNVSASKTPIPGSKAERLKIESREQPLDVSRVNLSRQPTIREWIVFSSTLPEHHIRNSSALETNRKHKVEARCGIAAQISPKPIVKRGRLFMDVPTSQYLGLPVTISADLVVQSDRKILPATGQDGADWNQWMFESQIAPLYAFFLEVLSHIPECDVYNYWPERPIQSKPDGDISYLVSRAFWDQVLDSKSLLFPVKTCDTKDSGAVNETIDYAAPHQARFNLLDNTLVNQLLPKLDLEEWKVVNLKGAAHLGFRSLYESNSCRENLNVISPEFVSGILKSGENAAILHETWKTEHRFSMSFMNSLLKFMTGAGLSTLDGCRILPLATNTLGCLGLGGSRASDFLIPPNESTLRKEILSLFPGVSVHPELTKDVLDTLIPAKPEGAPILNISRFSIEHLPRLISMLKDIDLVQKYNFAVAVWGWYNKLQDAESLNAMEILKTLPVIAATKANDESTYEFLTLEDYNSGVLPAVIKSLFDGKGLLLSWELDALNKMLQSFTGLLLISPNTFPAKSANDQRLVNPGGLHRFLNCIKTLAEKKGCNIESFVRDTFSANPEMLKTLGRALQFADWDSFQSKTDSARKILRQIPILPSGRQSELLSAQSALLAPSTAIDLGDISEAEKFVDSTYARYHSKDLAFLQPTRMSLPDFLEIHLSVTKGAQVSPTALDRHVKTLKWLSDEFPDTMGTHAVAVNGNGVFCTADSLYDHHDSTFMAAFHHQPSKFLHPKLHHLSWRTIKAVTSARVYRQCALGIEEQAAATPVSQLGPVIERAKTVHDFLLWETTEMRSVYNDPTWSQMVGIAFVPALCPKGNDFRNTTMRGLLPSNRLIKLSEGVEERYMAICWSQKPVFLKEPSPNVLSRTPGSGRPTPQTVIKHLRFLSDNAKNVEKGKIPQHVADVRECYRYLQTCGEPVSVPDDNSVIWFNTDEKNVTTPKEFINSWMATKNLCLGIEYDSGRLKQVRHFLKPYIELLMRYGVKEVTGPRAPPAFQRAATEYPYRILSQLNQFRKEGQFIDLEVIVQGTKLGVHRAVLCAASKYFKRMFRSGMRETVEDKVTIKEMTVETANRIFDYIYTGEMTPVTPSDDPTDELEQLLALLEASNRFELLELKSMAEIPLCDRRYMRPETVNDILRSATELNAQTLKTVCEEYMAKNRDIMERIEREEGATGT